MNKDNIGEIRQGIGLSQPELGQLLGVHKMTVSRWERGEMTPGNYQKDLLLQFERSAQDEKIKETLGALLIGAGVAIALFILLKASFNSK